MSDIDRDQYLIKTEPYYRLVHNEVEMYQAAYDARMPVMLKGPTGCGKSRFVEYMAWKLQKPLTIKMASKLTMIPTKKKHRQKRHLERVRKRKKAIQK